MLMPEPYDASDPKVVGDARAEAGRRAKKLDDFVGAAIETAEGRLWFWDILSRCHIFSTVFTPGDGGSTAFRDGERNVGLQILTQLMRVSPETFALMMKENISE
jgi:hypothetical protein